MGKNLLSKLSMGGLPVRDLELILNHTHLDDDGDGDSYMSVAKYRWIKGFYQGKTQEIDSLWYCIARFELSLNHTRRHQLTTNWMILYTDHAVYNTRTCKYL